jgi:hypothetical protein
MSPVLSIVYTADLLFRAEKWADCRIFMYVDNGNLLTSGPSYHIVAKTLATHYGECLAWLHNAGLSIENEKMEAIFYSPPKLRPDSHGNRPSTIAIPADDTGKLTIQCSDTVRYLGLFFNHKLDWTHHTNIMVTRTRGTLKALQLLGNSI